MFPLGPPMPVPVNLPRRWLQLLMQGREYCSNNSSRSAGSLWNLEWKGKRGVKEDSEVPWIGKLVAKEDHWNQGARLKCYKLWECCRDASDDIMWHGVTTLFTEVGNEAGVVPLCWFRSSRDCHPVLQRDIWSKLGSSLRGKLVLGCWVFAAVLETILIYSLPVDPSDWLPLSECNEHSLGGTFSTLKTTKLILKVIVCIFWFQRPGESNTTAVILHTSQFDGTWKTGLWKERKFCAWVPEGWRGDRWRDTRDAQKAAVSM